MSSQWAILSEAVHTSELTDNEDIRFHCYDGAVWGKVKAQDNYPKETLHKGIGDAFRHAYWSAFMCFDKTVNNFDINCAMSKRVTEAYERISGDSGITSEMDKKNNEKGRELAKKLWPISLNYATDSSGYNVFFYEILVDEIKKAVEEGKLYQIVDNKIVYTSNRGVVAKPLGITVATCPTQVEVGVPFVVKGSCINAHHTAISIDGVNWSEHNGNSFSRTVTIDTEGKHDIVIYARNTEDEYYIGTQATSKKIEVNVTRAKSDIVSKTNIDKFIDEYSLPPTSKAVEGLKLINTKYSDHDLVKEYSKKTIIHVVEGAGNYSDTNIPYHPNGRFGAAAYIIKNGEVVHFTPNASTLPDNPMNVPNVKTHGKEGYKATILPNVFYGAPVMHRSSYPGVRIEASYRAGESVIPAVYADYWNTYHKDKNSNGIHLHAASENSLTDVASEGCITICRNIPRDKVSQKFYYNEFGVDAGFMKMVKGSNGYNEIETDFDSLVIIDRSLVDTNVLKAIYVGMDENFINKIKG